LGLHSGTVYPLLISKAVLAVSTLTAEERALVQSLVGIWDWDTNKIAFDCNNCFTLDAIKEVQGCPHVGAKWQGKGFSPICPGYFLSAPAFHEIHRLLKAVKYYGDLWNKPKILTDILILHQETWDREYAMILEERRRKQDASQTH